MFTSFLISSLYKQEEPTNETQILTMRVTMFMLAWLIVSPYTRTFYAAGTCKWVHERNEKYGLPAAALGERYPTCVDWLDGKSLSEGGPVVAVRARFRLPEERAVTMNMTFGTAGWLAMVVHMVVVEWWLSGNRDSKVEVRRKEVGLGGEEVMKMET